MMLRDMGYEVYRLKDLWPILRTLKKINKIKDRQVYKHCGLIYKIIDEGLPYYFWDVLKSEFYITAAPTLRGIIFDGENGVGYVQEECISLHMNPKDLICVFSLLKDLYNKTGFVFADCHSQNFGKTPQGFTILDLESVTPCTRTKNIDYNKHIGF